MLAQHGLGDAELANVMHEAGAGEDPELRGAHRHLAADVDAEPRDPQVVGACLAVLDLEAERHHGVEPGSDLLLYRRMYRCRGTSSRTSSGRDLNNVQKLNGRKEADGRAKNDAKRLRFVAFLPRLPGKGMGRRGRVRGRPIRCSASR